MLDVSLVLSIKNQVSSGKFEILDTGCSMLIVLTSCQIVLPFNIGHEMCLASSNEYPASF